MSKSEPTKPTQIMMGVGNDSDDDDQEEETKSGLS